MTYYWWTEALDLLTSCKDCMVKWRKEFTNKSMNEIDYLALLEKCGLWGNYIIIMNAVEICAPDTIYDISTRRLDLNIFYFRLFYRWSTCVKICAVSITK
jgi:hypothetical protein